MLRAGELPTDPVDADGAVCLAERAQQRHGRHASVPIAVAPELRQRRVESSVVRDQRSGSARSPVEAAPPPSSRPTPAGCSRQPIRPDRTPPSASNSIIRTAEAAANSAVAATIISRKRAPSRSRNTRNRSAMPTRPNPLIADGPKTRT